MSWIIGDGFDYYGAFLDGARGIWDSVAAGGFAVGRFTPGQGWVPSFATINMTKNFPSNENTVFVVFAYKRNGALSGNTPEVYFILRDGATAQCSISLESGGNITLRSGIQTGTVLATFPAAYVQDAWTHFQCRIVIDPTAGSFTVRRNGSPTDTFTATGLNTRGGTANSYANVFAGGGNNNVVDDLLVYSASGAAPNDWVGDIRALQMPVVGDTATAQYTVTPTALAQNVGECLNAGVTFPAGTIQFCGPLTITTRSGSVDRIRMNLGPGAVAMTGHVKAAIYLNDGPASGPATLIAVSQEVTNPAGPSAVIDFAFSPPAPWSWRRQYYIALLNDAPWNCNCVSTSFGTPKTMVQPYASGFPATATGPFIPGGLTWQFGGIVNITGHAIAVSDQQCSSPDTDYTSGTAAGQAELYEIDNIVGTPIAIIGVVSKAFVKKSDAGARTGQLVVRSGATEVVGVDTALSTTWSFLTRVDTVDPATGLAWTPGSFAGIQIGTRVTS